MTRILTFLAVLGLTANACIDFETYCTEKVDCEDGNEADVDACVVGEDAGEEIADLYGCTDELALFAECREADSTCENDRYQLLNNDCDDEAREYNSCLSDNLPF